jgi:hypothetical protein
MLQATGDYEMQVAVRVLGQVRLAEDRVKELLYVAFGK